MVHVSNLISPKTGRAIANQFVISGNECFGFQSYQTLIAYCDGNGQWFLNWDFYDGNPAVRTHTTVQNFNYFLQRYGIAKDWHEFEHRSDIKLFRNE